MRIGLLTTSFPRAEHDVPGIFVLGFARSLAALGHHIEVLAPEPAEAREPPDFGAVQVAWVRYLRPRGLQQTFYGAGVLDNLRRSPAAWLGLAPFTLAMLRAAHDRARHWDALVSHWALPSALIAGLVRGPRPHVAVLHSADVFLLERLPMRTQLAREILRGASACVCSSRDLRRRFLALLPAIERGHHAGRVHVCPMGIELPAPCADRDALRARFGLSRFTVLTLGRLIPLKGVEHVIDAVARLPDAELLIVGDGPERAALEQHARQKHARVRFLGEQHGADKSALLHAADAFVLGSVVAPSGRSEGMPTTVLEAMAHGLPVVATDVGGVRDVLEDGRTGRLVKPGKPLEIASALESLRDLELRARLAEGGREQAASYAWSELGPRFLALLTGDC